MAGLDTRGAFDGFVQGFGLMQNYQDGQDRKAYLQQRQNIEQRGLDMREQEFSAGQEDRQSQQDQQQIAQFYTGWASGIDAPITPELEQAFERNKLADPRHLFRPETEAAVQYADKLAKGEGSLFSKQTVDAMNDFYAPRVNRGAGGKKRLAGMYPGQREGSFVFELEVEDEQGNKRLAPMTVNRGLEGEDDEVAQYEIDQAIGPVMGAKSIYQALGQNREKMLSYLRSSGYLPEEKERWGLMPGPDGSLFKVNQHGEPEQLLGRAPQVKDNRTSLQRDIEAYQAQYPGASYGQAVAAIKGKQGGAGALPSVIQKLEDADIEAAAGTFTMNSELDRIAGQLESGALDLGPIQNRLNAARNWAGSSTEESRNYGSMTATLERLRNESLRLNTGVQTDGDAQRAWNELVTNINDPKLVRQRLQEIKALNERAFEIRQSKVNQRRANTGASGLDLRSLVGPGPEVASEQLTGSGAQQQGGSQQLQQAAPISVSGQAEYQSLPPGTLYAAPDGRVRRKQ